jgi:Flp pilus assembly protein TadD
MRALSKHIFVIAMVVVLSATVYAQRERDTYTSFQSLEISGQVRLQDLGEPAPNVLVRLERFSGGLIEEMTTDAQGRFRFGGLARGYYTIIVNAQGFESTRQHADLQVLFKAYLIFELARVKAGGADTSVAVIDARVPATAREYFAKASSALRDKKPESAVPHFEKALLIYPEFFEAQYLLATTHMKLRDWTKAESTLNRALEIKPGSPAVILSLGEVYWRQKRFADAEQKLREGLKLDEKSWQGHFTLGRLYWDMNQVAKAGPPIGMTLQLKPDLAEAHVYAGNILLRVNQPERALVEYREYLRLAPKGELAAEVRDLIRRVEKTLKK